MRATDRFCPATMLWQDCCHDVAAFGTFPMSSLYDQQPIRKTVGRRQSREGRALTPADREAMTAMASYRTRVPKGVFIYESHEQMEADWLRWHAEAVATKARSR